MNKMIGHTKTLESFINLYRNNHLPNKILLNGKKGIGKSLLVNSFLFNIYKDKNSKNLILSNSHPNIFRVSKNIDKKSIEMSQVRDLIRFQHSTSFNNCTKTIIIDDLEFLNINTANALLKTLEEPNENVIFFLINNIEYKVLETIKSRCIEYKLKLSESEIISIVNNYFDQDIYNQLSFDFINYYNTPSYIINLIKYFNDNNLNFIDISIEKFLLHIVKSKDFKSNSFINENLNYFIELFFYKNIKLKNISYKLKDYFYYKFSDLKRYNLDMEAYFLEFKQKLLRE
tara:strand:- start:823 stop:1683 length:861 start_codon:yes stop_codon:yes gene_type:complete